MGLHAAFVLPLSCALSSRFLFIRVNIDQQRELLLPTSVLSHQLRRRFPSKTYARRCVTENLPSKKRCRRTIGEEKVERKEEPKKEEKEATESSINDKSMSLRMRKQGSRSTASKTPETKTADPKPSTSNTKSSKQSPKPSTSTAQPEQASVLKENNDVVSLISDSSTEASDNETWTNSKDVARSLKTRTYKCQYCDATFQQRCNLTMHITRNCMSNPHSKARTAAGLYRCNCGRNFKEVKLLRYHQKHECQKTVTCPQCFVVLKGSYVPERHKLHHCVNKRRNTKLKHEEDELFINDTSDEFS